MEFIENITQTHYPNLTETVEKIYQSQSSNDFQKAQFALLELGLYVNAKESNIPSKNFDELLCNITLEKETLYELYKLGLKTYPDIFNTIIIRGRVRQMIEELLESNLFNYLCKEFYYFQKIPKKSLKKIVKLVCNEKKCSEKIENGIMLYSVMIANIMYKDTKGILDENFRSIYFTKSNCVVCSLHNQKYGEQLAIDILFYKYDPINIAFMKRTQLLPVKFEDIYNARLKWYEELGLTGKKEDYKEIDSTVQCPKCKLFHTSYTQLQTRSADEPMTIFWFCHKCQISGRQ